MRLGDATRQCLRSGIVMTALLVAIVLVSMSVWILPRTIPENIILSLFFGPAYVFPFDSTFSAVGVKISSITNLAVWLFVIVAFSCATRRLGTKLVLLSAIATIAVVTTAMHKIIALLGWRFQIYGQ